MSKLGNPDVALSPAAIQAAAEAFAIKHAPWRWQKRKRALLCVAYTAGVLHTSEFWAARLHNIALMMKDEQ